MLTYYIALGSNLGEREAYLAQGLEGIERVAENLKVSLWYDTPPWGPVKQDSFLNGIVRCESTLPPLEMLQALLRIEEQAGRVRTLRWGPRTLDLDIVWIEDDKGPLVIEEENLSVPHVEFWNRLFVLEPLADVYPHLIYAGSTIKERIETLRKDENHED